MTSLTGALVFVGERRSRRAIRLHVSWQDGRLAAKTLHEALRAANVAPEDCIFVNVFHDDEHDQEPCGNALAVVRSLSASGATMVGLGRTIQRILRRAGITHLPLTHPLPTHWVGPRARCDPRPRHLPAACARVPERPSLRPERTPTHGR